jgi:hypothetical protein
VKTGAVVTFKESETVELKKSTSELKEAIISIGAMLNKHSKATVYFGIDDSGAVFGQCFDRRRISDYGIRTATPDLLKRANKLSKGRMLGFVAGRKRKESNKWDSYIIDKRELANQILAQMKRI